MLYDVFRSITIQDELAEEFTDQYSGDEPLYKANRKSHSHSDGEPVSDTNRKLPYDEIDPGPLN